MNCDGSVSCDTVAGVSLKRETYSSTVDDVTECTTLFTILDDVTVARRNEKFSGCSCQIP